MSEPTESVASDVANGHRLDDPSTPSTVEIDVDELAELRRRVAELEERSLNATDSVIGAEAVAAQARRDADDYFHRLHLRERELEDLKESLGYELDTPIQEILPALARSSQSSNRLTGRKLIRAKPRR